MPRTRSLAWAELKFGLIAVFALVMAGLLIFAVGGSSGFFWQNYPLKVKFDNVAGLMEGSPVRVAGVEVGSVSHVELLPSGVEVWFDVKDELPINATRFSANHHMHQLDFNLRANLSPRDAAVRPYAIVGPGVYHRTVEITEYEGSGVICDPYWYVCGVYPVSSVVGSRSSWDWGFNIGGGVGFGLGEDAEFYIEMRYHYTGGPEFTPPAGLTGATGGSANGNYLPLTFGFRF